MAVCRVVVEKKDGKFLAYSKTVANPKLEHLLDAMPEGKEVVIDLIGEGERSIAHRDFVDLLHERAEQMAKELGAERLYWILGNKK